MKREAETSGRWQREGKFQPLSYVIQYKTTALFYFLTMCNIHIEKGTFHEYSLLIFTNWIHPCNKYPDQEREHFWHAHRFFLNLAVYLRPQWALRYCCSTSWLERLVNPRSWTAIGNNKASVEFSLLVVLTELLGPNMRCVTPAAQVGFKEGMEEEKNISTKALSLRGCRQSWCL